MLLCQLTRSCKALHSCGPAAICHFRGLHTAAPHRSTKMQNLTILWCIYMHIPVFIQIYSKVKIHADLQGKNLYDSAGRQSYTDPCRMELCIITSLKTSLDSMSFTQCWRLAAGKAATCQVWKLAKLGKLDVLRGLHVHFDGQSYHFDPYTHHRAPFKIQCMERASHAAEVDQIGEDAYMGAQKHNGAYTSK